MRQASRAVAKAFDFLVAAGAVVASALVAAMALTIGLEVLMRRVFSNSLPWVIQVNEYFVLAIPFLAGAWLLKQDGHTRLTLIQERMSPRIALSMKVATSILAAIVCSVLVWKTGGRVWDGIQAETIIRGDGFNVSQVWIWWVLPYGFALLVIQFLRDTYNGYRRLARGEDQVDLPSPSEFNEI